MIKDLCDLTMVIDRSGSMASVRNDSIGGYNSFIKDQREQAGNANVTFYQFDDQFDNLYTEVDIQSAPLLTTETYVPRGGTALVDALAKAINLTGERLAAKSEAERPATVIIVVLTDGEENASIEFTTEQLAAMVTLQQDTYNWKFVFLGANMDAFAVAGALNISRITTLNYAATPEGTRRVYADASGMVSSLRTTTVNSDFAPQFDDASKIRDLSINISNKTTSGTINQAK